MHRPSIIVTATFSLLLGCANRVIDPDCHCVHDRPHGEAAVLNCGERLCLHETQPDAGLYACESHGVLRRLEACASDVPEGILTPPPGRCVGAAFHCPRYTSSPASGCVCRREDAYGYVCSGDDRPCDSFEWPEDCRRRRGCRWE